MKEEEIRPKELFGKYLALSKYDAEKFDKNSFSEVNCVCCGSSITNPFLIKYGFTYKICESCGSLFCSPRPNQEQLNTFYRESISAKFWFEEFLPAVEESRRIKLFRQKAISLKVYLEKEGISFKDFCDCGAGSGIFIEEMMRFFPERDFYAIEPGEISAKILKDKGFKTLQKNVEESNDWHNKFDFVVSLEVLEHVYNPELFVASLANLLKEGGNCLVTTLGFDGFDILTLLENSNSISPPHHLNFPSLKGFEELFIRTGFKEVKITTPGLLDLDIVLNSGIPNMFVSKLVNRGVNAINEFQEFLIKHKLSSHTWILAKR